ncbi:MAG: TonB family protein [Vicinamibacterales bacterium]|jgi:TonB family protein|nr:TonB family protein [Vicinamibacterales bacterium]|tara:strand:- start:3096 stop:3890 length:795 start_codon:yes stop_codon:yes gene_type:complete
MKELATQVLAARSGDRDGWGRMFGLSAGAHVVGILLLLLIPADWGVRAAPDEGPVMTISLGGPPGPDTGGLTPLGGRPVQQINELPPDPRPGAVRVPAREEPEMTVPTPEARRREVVNPPDVESSPEGARGRTRAEGDDIRSGDALAETGVQGLGFGLSTGGAGGTAGYLDVGSFCCPEYLQTMLDLIRRNWNPRQQVTGDSWVKFTIRRDGSLVDVEVERPSGYIALDMAAQRALAMTAQLPPLPSAFTEDSLTVHMDFQYRR